jgi:sodium/proline symporter
MEFTALLAFLLYLSIIICIGLFASHKNRSSSGFILGNRSLNYWVTAISANASDMSVWLFMGFPAAIFSQGLFQAWVAVGLVFFMFLNWHFVAPRLRRASEEYNAVTLFSFFERRLGHKASGIRILGALFSTIFLTTYIAAGLTGMGYLFESIFGINYALGCALSVLAILCYISIGGFTAVAYTDFVQGIFLLGVVLTIPFLILIAPPSESYNHQALQEILAKPFWPHDKESLFLALTLAFGWGIGYFGQPHILNKFMAIKSADDLYKSKWLGTAWQVLALSGAVLIGIAAHYFFLSPPSNPQLIFVDMTKALFTPFFASFILCAIVAATLSTIDSQILVVASAISYDFFPSVFPHKANDKAILLMSRLSAVATCIVALCIALFKFSSIFSTVYYCWVGMGATFGPLVIASLFFRRLSYQAALLGMLSGGLVGLFWILLDSPVSANIPGSATGLLVIWLLSKRA